MLHRLGAVVLSLISLSACWADEGPDDLRYDIVAYPGWQVIVFYDHANSLSGFPDSSLGRSRNSGWDSSMAGSSNRNFQRLQDDPTGIRFNVIWYEVSTKQAYQTQLHVDARELGHDTISPEAGLLIMRIARGGDIQAVTYDHVSEKGSSVQTVLTQQCAEPISISDPEMLAEIDRLLADPIIKSANSKPLDAEKVPSSCD